MKTILLMSCALCAGMNGYGMMVDSMRESNNVGLLNKSKTKNNATSLLSPKTDQNASSLKRTGGNRQSSVQEGQSKKICTKTEPEPPQKELDVVSDEKDSSGEIKETSRSGSGNITQEKIDLADLIKQRKLQDEMYQAHCNMVQKVSKKLDDWFNLDGPLDQSSINDCLKQWTETYKYPPSSMATPDNAEAQKLAICDKEFFGSYATFYDVFEFIILSMLEVISDEQETHVKRDRAQGIKNCLNEIFSKKVSSLEEKEKNNHD